MIGQKLLHYEITEKIGEGGMGVVYKARDTHLDRFVAIKVLPPEKVADAGRKARFVQEAKAASALNHPNIVHVYGISSDGGTDFIAMEHVAGKTLDRLIGRKGLSLKETLDYAIQAADALTKAHAAGIVHRDLKPSNIMVTGDGLVKVLDFGLAKLTETVAPASAGEFEPTRTVKPHTEEGMIVGTAAYMSPEQAEGKPVDVRSDIFSFGAVLYEMVTGARAFRGDSRMSTLAAVLHHEPAPMGVEIPRELERIIRRCLRKDPARRSHHMVDLKVELEEVKVESESGSLMAVPKTKQTPRAYWLAALAVPLIGVAGALLGLRFYGRTGMEQPLRAVPLTSLPGLETQPSFSPDGTQVAFVWNGPQQDNRDIYVILLGSDEPQRRTTDPAPDHDPVWSPDGRSIAFLRQVSYDRAIVITIPFIGGPEHKLAEVRPPSESYVAPPHLAWSTDSRHLVVVDRPSTEAPYALFTLSVESGEKRRITDPPPGTIGDSGPAVSPDGLTLVFSRMLAYPVADLHRVAVGRDLARRGDERRVTTGVAWPRNPAWSADGKSVVFAAGHVFSPTLWRVGASGSGTPRRLPLAAGESGDFTISRDGSRLALSHSTGDSDIWIVDLTRSPGDAKARRPLLRSTRNDRYAQFSPDGRRIAFVSERTGNAELWVSSADGTATMRLTSFAKPELWLWVPRWSPDGKRLVISADLPEAIGTYIVDTEGGSLRRLPIRNSVASGWSADGRYIYFFPGREVRKQVWKLPLAGGEAVQVTQSGGAYAIESPDGKLVYFTRNWPGPSSLWSVPVGGGKEMQVAESVWSTDFEVGHGQVYRLTRDWLGPVVSLNTQTRAAREVALLPHKWTWNFSVSRDGRSLLYGAMDPNRHDADILLVENFR